MNKLIYPLYHIRPYKKLWTEDGITYITTEYRDYILDNKNIVGNTLGERRLRLGTALIEDQKIYPLRNIFYTSSEILLHRNNHRLYIDSVGTLFTHTRKKRVNLIYKRVISIHVEKNILLCECEDIFRPITIPYIPEIMPNYLGLLVVDGDYLLYELSNIEKKTTWRLV